MARDEIIETAIVGVHFVILWLITWMTGQPFLFPSLGPSAYLLAAGQGKDPAASSARHIIGGHVIAVIAGLIGFHVFVPGSVNLSITQSGSAAFSPALIHLGASTVVAMMLTTLGMLLTETDHAAACATTLIVSLGILATVIDAITIVLAIVILVGAHKLLIVPVIHKSSISFGDPR